MYLQSISVICTSNPYPKSLSLFVIPIFNPFCNPYLRSLSVIPISNPYPQSLSTVPVYGRLGECPCQAAGPSLPGAHLQHHHAANTEDLSKKTTSQWEETREFGHNNMPATGYIYNKRPYM